VVETSKEHNVAWRGKRLKDERDADLDRAVIVLRRKLASF